jgi:5-methylcytosine-specific restriction endonuclease McrA
MSRYALSHLSDSALLRDLKTLVARDRTTTAELLAYLAEVDERKLYLPAAYPSMYAWCVGELGLCEQAAFKRIRAARAARQFPAIFPAIAEGRLHLSAVVRLASYLTPENSGGLLAAAAHQNMAELEKLLAERFPQPDVATRLEALAGNPVLQQLSSRTVAPDERGNPELSPGTVVPDERGSLELAAATLPPPPPRPRVTPLAPERYALQLTLPQRTHDKLQHAKALLGHALPSGDLAEVLDRALDALIEKLERRKCAAASRPRATAPRRSNDPRHIPAAVRREVWARDGGRCTFVSDNGHRCGESMRLEFDHVEPVARGGRATVAGLRLRCRAHNQYEAERAFGTGFMKQKRREHRRTQKCATARRGTKLQAQDDVMPWLRRLGIGEREAREAVALSGATPEAPLEERVRLALRQLGPPQRPVAHGVPPAA